MGRSVMLMLGLLGALAVASASSPARWMRLGDGDDPEPSCLSYTDEESCLEHTCGWCSTSVGDLSGCVADSLARLVPSAIADCRVHDADDDDDDEDEDVAAASAAAGGGDPDKPSKKKPASCGDIKEKHDCVGLGAEEGDCAWCKGDFMPPSCVGVKAAEWIPEQVAKCKMPKKHKKGGDVARAAAAGGGGDPDKPSKKKPASCGDIKEKHDCVDLGAEEGDCAWCKGDFMPPSCVGVKAAEWIPEQVAKCKMPKKHQDTGDADALLVKKKHSKKGGSGGSGGGWIPGGGDYPSGGGDYPSGGGDYPSGGGGQGQGCMGLKSKKKCLKGTDTEACAWCGKSSFLGSPCVSESQIKYLPKMVADCKVGKGPKKNEAVASS